MRRISARALLNYSNEEMWSLPDEQFVLEFDDGTLITNTRRTIFSFYHWKIAKQYPRTPLLVHHHMGNKPLSPETSLNILSNYSRDVHNAYADDYDREELWKLMYEIVNDIYNTFTVRCEEYMTSSDILDYLEIFDHPDIATANENVRPNQKSLDFTTDKIIEVMKTDDSLKDNAVARAVRANLVKVNQVAQIVGPRGYLTDIDSNIFETPILLGYFEGISTLYDSMIESRSAAKALTFTKKPLRQVEYFNRKMQLSTSNVHDLVMGDCGTKKFSTITIDKHLLKCMEGKYYIDGERLIAIGLNDTHLIGKTLHVRSAFYCAYRGAASVCSCCFGELAYSVPLNTNLGHVSSTEMCHEGSQLVMSVKHYDGSSKVIDVEISESDSRYVKAGSRVSTLALNPKLKAYKPFLLMVPNGKSIEGAEGLTNITPTSDVELLSVQRTTSFRDVIFGTTDPEGYVIEDYVTVSVGSRFGSLSREFLKYIQQVGYTITDTGMYRVELEDWGFDEDVFILPMRHLNMLDAMSEIEVFIRSPRDPNTDKRIGNSKKLIDYTSLDEALLDLNEMVSARLSVNIAHLEVIMLSLLRSATDPHDYRIPDIEEPAMFESHSTLMEKRSMSVTMAYERQPQTFEDVDSYLITNRPKHILDAMIID
jgi:hypothetical protein